MGLKESGLRGSLRSVSTGVVAIPDSVVENLDHWWPIDEGEGSSITDGIKDNTASFAGSPTWVSRSGFVGGFGLDMDGDTDGWDTSLNLSGTDWNITGWVELGSRFAQRSVIFGCGTSDLLGNVNVDGDGILITYGTDPSDSEDGGLAMGMTDGGSFNLSGGGNEVAFDIPEGETVFFSANFDTSDDEFEMFVYDDSNKIGDKTGDSDGRDFGTLSDPTFFSNYDNSDDRCSGHDGIEIAVGITNDRLPESDIEQIWEDTKP